MPSSASALSSPAGTNVFCLSAFEPFFFISFYMNCDFRTVCHDEDGDGKNEAVDDSYIGRGDYDGDNSGGDYDYDSYCITVMMMMMIAMLVMKIKLLITVVGI